ncbi:MAG: L-threonine 3-dehydrogenase [Kiritimatiellia bacterium]|nr:L-threonine 3-dehydrogenase [Kiritimatiellia bacterium]
MKALVKRHTKPGLWMEEVPEPECGMNDVLVKIEKTGICGTDLHIYNWDEWAQKTIPAPMIIGHEFVGTILKVGSNVNDFKPGMVVSGEGHVVCGRCRNCMAGRRHLCAQSSGIGVNRSGAFAELIAIPNANVWEHFTGIPREIASIFDPLGNAVHTALQWDLLGEDVLIAGAGTIGVLAAAVCRHAGARHVVVTDVNAWRLELAKRMGATRAVDVSREKLADVQRELGMHEGFDIGLEMSGNPAGLRDLVDNLCHGGKISVLGIPNGAVNIDWHKVIFNMLTLKGIYGREIYDTWYKMSVMIQSGLDISPVITHRLPFQEFEQGFQAMRSGQCGKVVLDWAGSK